MWRWCTISRATAVRQNGQLCYADPDMLLNNAANAKLRKYREALVRGT